MRESTVHAAWKSGRHVLNGWLSIANSFSAELMAKAGWDSITIDLQHGLIDYQAAVGMMQAIATTSTASLVRVPWNDPAIMALNPGLPLPQETITVVSRSDGSGTTFLFVNYLSKISADWKAKIGRAHV